MLDKTGPLPSSIENSTPRPARQSASPIPLGPTDVALLAMATIWGLNFVVVKPLLPFFPPPAFVAARFILASVAFFALVRVRQGGFQISRREWGFFLVLGIFGTTLYQTFFINGLALTKASHSALILAATPVFIVLLNRIFRHERLSARGWLGIALSLVGIALIVFSSGVSESSSSSLLGDGMILGATLCWSVYSMMAAPMLKRHSPLSVTALATILGTIPLLVIGAPALMDQDWSALTLPAWAALLYSALLSIVLANTIWNLGLRKLGGARTALYSNLTPVIAALAAAVVLNEALTPLTIAGAVIIFGGLYLARTTTTIVEPEG